MRFCLSTTALFLISTAQCSLAQTWTQKLPTASPSGREAPAMAYDAARQQVVLFGGQGETSFNQFADTWVWDGTTWAQKFPTIHPSARVLHAMAYDAARQQVVLFAGAGTGYNPLGDTWVWDGSNWTQKFPVTVP